MSIFTKIFSWFKKEAVSAEHEAAKLGVLITEAVKYVSKEGVKDGLDFVGSVVDFLTKSGIGTEAVTALEVIIPEGLKIKLGLADPNTDADQVIISADAVLKAISLDSDESEFWTKMGITFAKRIQAQKVADNGSAITFGQWATLLEAEWQDYKAHSN